MSAYKQIATIDTIVVFVTNLLFTHNRLAVTSGS